VTKGTSVSYRATDAAGNLIGLLSDISPSDASRISKAEFTPTGSAHIGRVTITALVEGVRGRTIVELVN